MPSKTLPPRPSLTHLKHQARDLLNAYRARHPEALARAREFHPRLARLSATDAARPYTFSLSDAQWVIAREYGFESWSRLKQHVESVRHPESPAEPAAVDSVSAESESPIHTAEQYENLARDYVSAHESGDAAALQRLSQHYKRTLTQDDVRDGVWHRVYKVRQAKARPGCFSIADAQELMAREAGFGNWDDFVKANGAPPPGEPYAIEGKSISPRRSLSDREWEQVIAEMKEQQLTALDANGQMTDAVLRRIAELDQVKRLRLGNSLQMTDDGLRHLARMPQLTHLDLSEYPGGRLTDRGLEVLRHLPGLRKFEMTWQRGITDAGVENLRFCDELESVNLLGTMTGDGAIRALRGKRNLRTLRTGRNVTDAGLEHFHGFPMFKTWSGGEPKYGLMSADAGPTHLLLDGPITDEGLSRLRGLDGLFGLSFFWHISALTSDGLRTLAGLANLGYLGCEGKLCNDQAMRHISRIPRLRKLMAQGTVATDEGFEALSQCRTLEYIWGRECANFTGRGFVALARMSSLRGMALSCKGVDDEALSTLPQFPALTELMPMDVTDAGFRHVGKCAKLEGLWCMYCRETTDEATAHIGGLANLRTYYAGLTKITDRSLEILGRMHSLEQIELYECKSITNAGLPFLATLPRLRKLDLHGLPHVTLEGTRVLPASVQVNYSA
jgi:hypothetical protein